MELERSFGGEAANLVKACGKSAVSLVALVTRHFPGILVLVVCFALLLFFVLVGHLILILRRDTDIDGFLL